MFFNSVLFDGTNWGNGVDADDNFDVFVDGVLVPPEDRNILAGGNPFPLEGISGYSISFGADWVTEDFSVAEINAAVPLPAPALLLLTGLGGLAVFRRRKG